MLPACTTHLHMCEWMYISPHMGQKLLCCTTPLIKDANHKWTYKYAYSYAQKCTYKYTSEYTYNEVYL